MAGRRRHNHKRHSSHHRKRHHKKHRHKKKTNWQRTWKRLSIYKKILIIGAVLMAFFMLKGDRMSMSFIPVFTLLALVLVFVWKYLITYIKYDMRRMKR